MEMLDQIERLRKRQMSPMKRPRMLLRLPMETCWTLILLERQAAVQLPSGDGYYSSARDRRHRLSHSGPSQFRAHEEGLGMS